MGRAIPDRQSDYLLNRRPELTWYTMGRRSNNNGLRIIIRIRSITGSKHELHQHFLIRRPSRPIRFTLDHRPISEFELISLILFVEPHIVLGTGRFIGFTWVSAFEDFIKNHLSWTIFRWIQSKTMFYLCSKEFLLIGNHFIFEWNCTSRDHHCISFTDSDIGKGWTMISILGIMFRIRGPGRLPPY